MNRNRLYALLGIACMGGYSWLLFNLFSANAGFSTCIFKSVTGIACPSCGSTRAITALIGGDVGGAFMINPLGIVIAVIMAVLPVWLLIDIIRKNNSLFRAYQSFEKKVAAKAVASILITFLLANWVWNICKGL